MLAVPVRARAGRRSGASRPRRASSRCRGRSSCSAPAPPYGRPRRSTRRCASAIRSGSAGRAAPPSCSPTIPCSGSTSAPRSLRGVAEERRSLLDLFFGRVYFFSHQPRALAVDTPVRQRRRRGHRVPGPGRRGSGRGGHARRPGAVAESARRVAGGERRCRAGPGGRGAGADDRRAAARCGGMGAVLPADPGGARRAARAAPRPAAGPAGGDRCGGRERLRRRARCARCRARGRA